jgi:hypothetical protein
MYSTQSVDLYLQDEFKNYLQNFRSPTGFTLEYDDGTSNVTYVSGNFIFLLIEGEFSFNNGIFTIPAWLAAMNPHPFPGNTHPLISPFSTYMSQPAYGLYACNGSGSIATGTPVRNLTIPPDFNPNVPISANLIHFGRVLGY